MTRTDALADAIAALWTAYREEALRRVSAIDAAVAAMAAGEPADELRLRGVAEAHKLAGTLATYGLPEATELARGLESDLGDDGADVARLGRAARELRALIERGPAPRGPAAPVAPVMLIVDADAGEAEELRAAAQSAGWRPLVAASAAEARERLDGDTPHVAVVDLAFAVDGGQERSLVFDLAYGARPVPTLVLGHDADLAVRLQIARGGATAFLARPQPPARVLELAQALRDERQAEFSGRVLAVDDDPHVLAAVRALLEPLGMVIDTADGQDAFWRALESAPPDLVLMDIQMPGLDGIELCQVLRNDSRWRMLPVIFLTARTDPQTVHRVFALGADDFVGKPIIGPELATRVTNRLERIRLFRRLAETDSLTGIANRQKGRQVLEHFMHLAIRQERPLSVAVLDVDHFKQVNDRHGHDAGDRVLRRMGDLLRGTLRGEDVVARWGGEEFVVGMYGADKQQAQARLMALMGSLRGERFEGADGEFSVTFSGGVAEFPGDGAELQALLTAADGALYQAKHAGRARVVPVGGVEAH